MLNNPNAVEIYRNLADDGLAPQSQSTLYKNMLDFAANGDPFNPDKIYEQALAEEGYLTYDGEHMIPRVRYPDADVDDVIDKFTVYAEFDYSLLERGWLDSISSVRGFLCQNWTVKNGDGYDLVYLCLGEDTGLKNKWWSEELNPEYDEIRFEGEFTGKWFTLEGQPVQVQVIREAIDENDSELYAVPILQNDKERFMILSYNRSDESCKLVEIRAPINPEMPDNDSYYLREGDIIKPRYLGFKHPWRDIDTLNNRDYEKKLKELEQSQELKDYRAGQSHSNYQKLLDKMISLEMLSFYEGKPITFGKSLTFKKDNLPDGYYVYMFEFLSPFNRGLMGIRSSISDYHGFHTMRNGNRDYLEWAGSEDLWEHPEWMER